MIDLPAPAALFNPITSSAPLTPLELLAGPLGLVAFLPLIPLVRLAARRSPHMALIASGALWTILTAGPISALVVTWGVLAGVLWIRTLHSFRLRGQISPREMAVWVWLGLTLLIAPLWWRPQWSWYGWEPSRMAPLHNLGFAYFFLRLVAWGCALARSPRAMPPLRDTAAWLAYAPCMRLGPVMNHETFQTRMTAWSVGASPPWREVLRRLMGFVLGGSTIVILAHNTPTVPAGQADFFEAPALYPTETLLRIIYHAPILIYLMLWTYNELASAAAMWVGIRVDDNFDRLPHATSVRDFWRRWHVTVGAWLRENIYIPLGGNTQPAWKTTSIVFAFCALWHGASWSFVAWGLAQAAALTLERWWSGRNAHQGRAPQSFAVRASAWLLTMHFQIVTILMFVDFQFAGTRILPELFRRFF